MKIIIVGLGRTGITLINALSSEQYDITVIDKEKALDWLKKGVQPTATVKNLLVNEGIIAKPEKLSPSKTKVRKSKK